jgi:hypothetical protein
MMEHKKPDLRDKAPAKTSVTKADAKLPGGDTTHDPMLPDSDMHVLTPEIGKNLADGQTTKSS